MDAAGKRMDIETVCQVYRAAANVDVRQNPAWSADALRSA
jgi:hypothetical protein